MLADVPGARLWYEDSGGAGAAVVLLHAGTGTSRLWLHQIPAFAGAGLRVIAYDRRGHGRSEGGSGGGVPAADDLAALLDALKVGKAHLVGTAAGAIVALDLALCDPGRVASLVLANTHAGVQDVEYVALQKRLRPAPQFDALPAEVKELGPSYRAANPEGVRRWCELVREARQAGTVTLPQTRTRLTFAELEKLRAPTLLVTGDADLYMPPPVLRQIAASIPGARTLVVAQAGHSAYWEQPELFNRAVLEFIAR